MANRAQKIKVGAFVLGGLGLALLAVLLLGTYRLWRERAEYYAWFDGSVQGLQPGAQVHVRGVPLGRIGDIELDPSAETTRVRVTLELVPDAPIREGSYAQLSRLGVSSLMYIDVMGGTPGAPLLERGADLPGRQPALDRAVDLAVELIERSDRLIAKGENLLDDVNELVDAEARARIDGIIVGVDELVSSLRPLPGQLNDAAAQARVLMAEGREAMAETRNAVAETRNAVAETRQAVTRAVTDAEKAIASARALIRNGERTWRLSEHQIRATLQNLQMASQSVKELGRMLRAQPSRLLFSDTPDDRKLP